MRVCCSDETISFFYETKPIFMKTTDFSVGPGGPQKGQWLL